MTSNNFPKGKPYNVEDQILLRRALLDDNYNDFKELIRRDAVDLEHVYQYPDYKSCLELAVTKPGKNQFVKLLLEQKVNVNTLNILFEAAPIHFAVENGNLEALRVLLEDKNIIIDLKSKGNTPLLLALKKKIEKFKYSPKLHDQTVYENMIELLLKNGCDTTIQDLENISPVSLAAEHGLERVLNLILQNSKDVVDLDKYMNSETSRNILKTKFPHILAKLDSSFKVSIKDVLFSHLRRDDEEMFIRDFTTHVYKNKHESEIAGNDGFNTMLQLATERCLERVVVTLLTSGDNPHRATYIGNRCSPIEIACRKGFLKILNKYLEHKTSLFHSIEGEKLLLTTITGMKYFSNHLNSDHMGCIKVLLEHDNININVNYLDNMDNTALYYAATSGFDDVVLELLRRGAYVGSFVKSNEMPLAYINAKTLEAYLDECITTNDRPLNNELYTIYMRYNFLIYPKSQEQGELCLESFMTNSFTDKEELLDLISAPETEPIVEMANTKELCHLLKHPVITTFLSLKWQRIHHLLWINTIFHALYSLCFVLYIMLGYCADDKQSDTIKTLNKITYIGAVLGFLMSTMKKIFLFIFSPLNCIRNAHIPEKISCTGLMIVTAWILFFDCDEKSKEPLSATAILFLGADAFFVIGKFPKMSTYIVMFKTVSWNFLFFILWYCILIIAFALSFNILLKTANINPGTNETAVKNDSNFFDDSGRSIFKTFVMLTGEFDIGSIEFNTFPVFSHIIFLIFILMVPIVLFNLLNGLAVSDIQYIQSNAELDSYSLLVEKIFFFEQLFICDQRPSRESWLAHFPKLDLMVKNFQKLKQNRVVRNIIHATRVSLFPYIQPDYRIELTQNMADQVRIFGERTDGYNTRYSLLNLKFLGKSSLDGEIVTQVNILINKKKHISEIDEVKSELRNIESKLEDIEKVLKNKKLLGDKISG